MRRTDKRPTTALNVNDAQQRATLRRHEAAVQIRKQNKDAMLRRKRGLPLLAGPVAPETQRNHLSSSIKVYLKLDDRNPEQLQQALASSDQETIKFVLERLLQDDTATARALAESLVWNLQNEETRHSALDICLNITSAVTSEANTSSNTPTDESDNYYGSAPLRWSDLLVSRNNPNTLLCVLLSLLKQHQQRQQQPSDSTQVVCHVIGNLVQDAPTDSLAILLPDSWSLLVALLPHSCYCCATIVRYDQVHYGMDFVHDMTPRHIAQLLADHATAVDAAWMLEALSRREGEVIHVLCRSSAEQPLQSSQGSLVDQLIQCIHEATLHVHTPSSTTCIRNQFLIPALRAVGNLAWACDGVYRDLLANHALCEPTVHRLLDDASVIDIVDVVGAFVAPSRHDGTVNATAVSHYVPRLVALVSDAVRLEWKRHAVEVVARVVLDDTTLLHDFIWNVEPLQREQWLDALLHLAQGSDVQAGWCAWQILDALLRRIPPSRIVFAHVGGVRILEDVSASSTGLPSSRQLATSLFDDFFDDESDDDNPDSMATSGIVDNRFVFGSMPHPTAFNFENAPIPLTQASDPTPMGRGRGRTVPSWMQQQQR